MKESFLLLIAALAIMDASAQNMLNLTGSSYYQSFDKIGTGLPKGWEIDSLASGTSKGYAMDFDTKPNAWSNVTGKSKNVAAKDTFLSTASSASQSAAINRAMGIRQTTPTDKGIAFTLTISQTQNLKNLQVSFNLQSLDSNSKRATLWEVQYGLGAAPSNFTTVSASGSHGLSTGNSTFSSSMVTASFGPALDSQTGPVIIRIVSLNTTSGTNNRATSAVDSFTLSWSGTPVVFEPQLVSFSPANAASSVVIASNLALTFDKNITAGPGNIYLKNRTDQTSISIPASSTDVTISGAVVTVSNLGLAPGKTYSVTFDTNAFRSGAFASFGIEDSTSWAFATINTVITLNSINENFDAACATHKLPAGWSRQNVQGPGQEWSCFTTSGNTNAVMQMGGSSGFNANEDWLITPQVNFGGTGSSTGKITFKMQKNRSGIEPDVLISNDYDGNSAPSNATWTSLNIPMTVMDTGNYKYFSKLIGSAGLQPFFIAFKYVSSATNGYRIRLDSVNVDFATGVNKVSGRATNMSLQILKSQSGKLQIAFNANAGAKMKTSIFDMVGRMVYCTDVQAIRGENRVILEASDLPSGMYLIRVGNSQEQGVTRAFVE